MFKVHGAGSDGSVVFRRKFSRAAAEVDGHAAVDDPARFASSRKVGPRVGMTTSRNQSGERDVSGGITKAGDVSLRRALCQAANVMIYRPMCGCPAKVKVA